eukprot:15483972-Heterocapsa_arctica.AAC.1
MAAASGQCEARASQPSAANHPLLSAAPPQQVRPRRPRAQPAAQPAAAIAPSSPAPSGRSPSLQPP